MRFINTEVIRYQLPAYFKKFTIKLVETHKLSDKEIDICTALINRIDKDWVYTFTEDMSELLEFNTMVCTSENIPEDVAIDFVKRMDEYIEKIDRTLSKK